MNEVLTNGSRPSPTPSNPSSTRNLLSPQDLPNASITSEIRCFCGYDLDDGFTIQCDKCSRWQHGICVKINPKNIPEIFICYYCEIRDLQNDDLKRAKAIQYKRFEGEGRKAPAHPKRTAGASHRKRETNGSGHSRSVSESLSHKPPSPKEQVAGKSRARQRPIPPQPHASLPDTSASPDEHSPTGKSPSIERDLASDSEVPPCVYTKEYTPISSNTIVSPEIDHKIKTWTHDALHRAKPTINASDSSIPCLPRRYSTSEFHQLIPSGHTVRWVSSPEELSALGLPLVRLVADAPSKADQFVIEYVGEIGSRTSYIQDTLNQYQRIRHPKAFVLFHPQLPIYIDARRCGSEARFVRRSCRPNLKFETMVIDGTDLRFALYTNQPIERGVELTIGWEWDPSLPFLRLLNGDLSLEDLDAEVLHKMSTWAEVLTTTVGECACVDRETCIMSRLKGDVPVGKPKKAAKAGTKRRWREMQDFNATGRDPSPEKHDPESKYKRRSSSTSSHRKSESRDRTPTFPSAEITQSSVITDQNSSAREARKMKETINLIEKLTNPDSSRGNKRIKRPTAGSQPSAQPSLPGGIPESNYKSQSPKQPADQALPQALATVAGGQPAALLDVAHSAQNIRKMQVNGISSQSATTKTSYVDGGVQTEIDVPVRNTPKPIASSRKMRILLEWRELTQQRENALKQQLSIVKEEDSLSKERLADNDTVMTDADASANIEPPANLQVAEVTPPNVMSVDVERTVDHVVKVEPPASADLETNGISVNGTGGPGTDSTVTTTNVAELQLQTPSGQTLDVPITNALPEPPKLQSPTPPALPSLPQATNPSPVSTPIVPVTAAQSSMPATPSVHKKMSLSEYSRKRAESQRKDKSPPVVNNGVAAASDFEGETKLSIPTESSTAMDLDPPNATSHSLTNGHRGS
ncbi:hypothetical protein Dda_6506 [Drechslerella dactyloides]|uniref:SET domain-containing protein n=1 Tax=Drechslerella dactyloides TaxID=74499 RepID=A0AAD6IVP6_DREDA|nr:hypothetical protein Dda_6506 [Drechslerella dactyloides]